MAQEPFLTRGVGGGQSSVMPIYEFACSKCRKIFSFLSKGAATKNKPVCPKCGNKRLSKEVSAFAMIKGAAESNSVKDDGPTMPNIDDRKIGKVMAEMERDMAHMDENNPRHMAHMMKKMKAMLPPGTLPKEMDIAIKRMEAGENPEKIEADMGDLLKDVMGGEEAGGNSSSGKSYTHDSGLYDY